MIHIKEEVGNCYISNYRIPTWSVANILDSIKWLIYFLIPSRNTNRETNRKQKKCTLFRALIFNLLFCFRFSFFLLSSFLHLLKRLNTHYFTCKPPHKSSLDLMASRAHHCHEPNSKLSISNRFPRPGPNSHIH